MANKKVSEVYEIPLSAIMEQFFPGAVATFPLDLHQVFYDGANVVIQLKSFSVDPELAIPKKVIEAEPAEPAQPEVP